MPLPTIYIGVDPGKASGGIAILEQYPSKITVLPFSKLTEKDIFDRFKELTQGRRVLAVLEKVASRPGQGVASTFRFGEGYGFLRGLLTALYIPYLEVQPRKWQSHFISGGKASDKAAHKRKLKTVAQRLFPEANITLETADAYLLAYYTKFHAEWKNPSK